MGNDEVAIVGRFVVPLPGGGLMSRGEREQGGVAREVGGRTRRRLGEGSRRPAGQPYASGTEGENLLCVHRLAAISSARSIQDRIAREWVMTVPSGSFSAGSFVVSGRLAQLVTRALAQERDRVAVGGDHLVVLDARGAERLLHAATRMDPRAAVIAVADEQGRGLVDR